MYYDLGHVHLNLGEFQYRVVIQKNWFSVLPLLSRFPSSNLISSCSCRLCTVWWRRSLKSPQKAEKASELQLTSFSDQYLLYVFMYSWVYGGAPQPCFSLKLYTLMTNQMTTIFCFPFYMGSCTRRLNLLPIFKYRRTSSYFSENQPKH